MREGGREGGRERGREGGRVGGMEGEREGGREGRMEGWREGRKWCEAKHLSCFLQPQEISIQCLTHEPPTGNNTTQKTW